MSFSPNELVWYNQDGQTHSAGFSIDSMLARTNMKPITTLNQPIQQGGTSVTGQFSDLFRYMGVPAGLSTILGDDVQNSNMSTEEGGLISGTLFDKLMSLAGPSGSSSLSDVNQIGGTNKKNDMKSKKKTRKSSQKGEGASDDKKKKRSRRTRRK